MTDKKILIISSAILLLATTAAIGQSLEENWNDFLHYTKIGHFDLAAGYAQVLLENDPAPEQLLALSQENPAGYALLLKVNANPPDGNMAEFSTKILAIIEQGRFTRRANPAIIVEEIARLSTTARGRLTALKRLQNAGEYSIMYMLDAMADRTRKNELSNIIWALPQIGRDSIRPLTAALQTDDIAIKAEIVKALGKIGYPQSLAWLKYVTENDDSAELREIAKQSIKEIDPDAANLPAAHLFFLLAENYYYHAPSLQPAEDAEFANIWFWNAESRQLVREKLDKDYFNELMAMQACEWALKADPAYGQAIALWVAAFFKTEATGVKMPQYFGTAHADAMVYATTAGPIYLQQALARALKDNNAYIALGVIEAMAVTAGEASLLQRIGPAQPLAEALSFDDKAVRFSAAIALAAAGPKRDFPESKLVTRNLAQALTQNAELTDEDSITWSGPMADSYAIRAAQVMLSLAQTRNKVIDLADAQDTLIQATRDPRQQIQILSANVLAYLQGSKAQTAIADAALNENNSMLVRIQAFNALAVSAKVNANQLDDKTIDAIYELVSSRQTPPQLNSIAAAAYGALNLPSQKVKDLILDQSKS
ncbi:HEAT repeat domain-containing protein [Planctomycetota bacterium]